MRGVVLRCPTCGTTQVTPGECEACSEGTVRYFCDNHSPGRWLDGPVCKACGATVGKAAPPAPERSRPVGPSFTDSRRPPAREVEIDDAPAAPSLKDLLTHLATERERPRFDVEEVPSPAPELPRRGSFFAGCLVRLLLLVLLFVALVVAGLFALFGGMFQ